MKQITINVEGSAYEHVLAVLQLCQQVEVVSAGDVEVLASGTDECFAKAIGELQDDRTIRNQYDYAFIYMAIQEGVIGGMEAFYSVASFASYLKELKVSNAPSKNSISNICTHTRGEFPSWVYDEPVDANEERRRRNVVFRFSSAFSRFMREVGR